MFRDAPSLFLAGAVFSVSNLALRVLNAELFLNEVNGVLAYLGLVLMLAAVFAMALDKIIN